MIEELVQAFDTARNATGQPKVLVCDTVMGKGVPVIEQLPKAHFVRIAPQEWEHAIREFEEAGR
jgi:transketolase